MNNCYVRKGKYCLYNGVLYKILSKSSNEQANVIRLCSTDKTDLKNGFVCNDTEDIIKRYGFVCTKNIFKSKITNAYEIRTYAIYRGFEMDVLGIYDNSIRLVDGGNPPSDEKVNRLLLWGFSEYYRERSWIEYDKYVSVNDPDLQLIEKRTELDISKL